MNGGEQDCVVWDGPLDKDGYGRSGKMFAHRKAYQDNGGTLIKGMEIDHLCRNRACVNPNHLEQVTHRENTFRGLSFSTENHFKTHCVEGHPFDEVNTHIRPDGARQCRKCNAQAVRRYKKRIKAA